MHTTAMGQNLVPMPYNEEQNAIANAGFDARRFFEEDFGEVKQEPDMAPLPLNPNNVAPYPSIDRNVLEDLYKSLSHGEQQQQQQQHAMEPFMMQQPQQQLSNLQQQIYNMAANQQQKAVYPNFQDQMNTQQMLANHMQPAQQFDKTQFMRLPIVHQETMYDSSPLNSLYNGTMPNSLGYPKKDFMGHQMAPPSAAPVNKPVKALSAYNFFFRDERERILNGAEEDYSEAKQQKLLTGHWFRDRSKKRRHRKTHGKIAFTTLSRMVSQRWKELAEERKNFYKEVAAKDLERYRRELHQIEQTKANTKPFQTSVVIARTA